MKQGFGTPYSVTAAGTTTVTATVTGVANTAIYITDVDVSTDIVGAVMLVSQGSTVLWQDRILNSAAGLAVYGKTFSTPLVGAPGASVTVSITGTTYCSANVAGFTR